jgi:hypothetical protein
MTRTAAVLASASALALGAVAMASSAYASGPGYHGGYSPTHYGYPYSGPTYYYIGPAYGVYTQGPYYNGYGYHCPRVVRPASVYYDDSRTHHKSHHH